MKIKFKYSDKIPPIFRNKYFVAVASFLLWITFFDANNLIDRIKQINQLHRLEKEKEYYEEKIAREKEMLNKLRTDDEYLEKFAREQYMMKKKNEDLFVVLTREENKHIKK